MVKKEEAENPSGGLDEQQVEKILQLARTIRYGSLNLVFQDGNLIQIERNEKIRLH